MKEHSFLNWIRMETMASRCTLLTLYEERDKLTYIEGPKLEQQYMEAVGSFEETVIKEEIECELLQKKLQMIQTLINRREPIDEEVINAALETERQEKYAEAVGTGTAEPYANLSGEQDSELQEIYHEIVRNYHPQTTPDLTEAHRELFQKAQDAYRKRDLEALRLIHEMLQNISGDDLQINLVLDLTLHAGGGDSDEDSARVDLATDYKLVTEIYPAFKPTAEEAAMQEEWNKFRLLQDTVHSQIEQIRSNFPFTAAGMLASQEETQRYKDELLLRLQNAKAEQTRRTVEIQQMIESVAQIG